MQAGSINANTNIWHTLDKIRSAEKNKKLSDSGQKIKVENGFYSVDKYLQRKPESLGHSQNRISTFEKKEEASAKKHREMELEMPFATEFSHKSGKLTNYGPIYPEYEGRDHPTAGFVQMKNIHMEQARILKPRGVDSATQTRLMQPRETNTTYEDNFYRRSEHEERHKRQMNPPFEANETYHSKRTARDMRNEDAGDRFPHSAESPAEGEFTFHQTPEHYRKANDYPRFKEKSTIKLPKSKSNTSKVKSHTPITPNTLTHSAKTRDTRQESHNVPSKVSKDEKRSMLDSWIKSESKSERADLNRQEKKRKENTIVHNLDGEALFDSQDEESAAIKPQAPESDNSGSDSPKKSERGIHNLHDWINRRVTGYLIFQNTMHDQGLEKEREDDHLNRIAGKKWKKLTKAEKEEYKSLALSTRVLFKKEFREVDKDDPDWSELQELIDQKLKRVKKE